eukprot:3850897-Amphidinium_carterae.1
MNDTGKIKFSVDRAAQRKIDVLFIQETRLSGDVTAMTVDGYELITSPAAPTTGSHGGLSVMVRVDPQISVVFHRCVSHRVLVVQLCIATKHCRLICAHAPIAEADEAEHAGFARHVEAALASTRPGEILLAGIDLNARLGDLMDEHECVGQHAASTCPLRAAHRQECLAAFSAAGLLAISTFVPHLQPLTWRHTSGTEQQIDFVFVP